MIRKAVNHWSAPSSIIYWLSTEGANSCQAQYSLLLKSGFQSLSESILWVLIYISLRTYVSEHRNTPHTHTKSPSPLVLDLTLHLSTAGFRIIPSSWWCSYILEQNAGHICIIINKYILVKLCWLLIYCHLGLAEHDENTKLTYFHCREYRVSCCCCKQSWWEQWRWTRTVKQNIWAERCYNKTITE